MSYDKLEMFLWKRQNDRRRNDPVTKEFSLLKSQKIERKSEFFGKARKLFNFDDIYRRGKKLEKRKDGMCNLEIENYLKSIPNFLGVIFDDSLNQIDPRFNGFVIVNLGHSHGPGTHWIALGFFKHTIEFFDPLGCDFLNWPNLPIGLLNYLFKASFTKTVVRINRLQSSKSAVCGLYCIFYVIHRRSYSLQTILDFFDDTRRKNDKKLVRYFR